MAEKQAQKQKPVQTNRAALIVCTAMVALAVFAVIIAAVLTTRKSDDSVYRGEDNNASTDNQNDTSNGGGDNGDTTNGDASDDDSSGSGGEVDLGALISIGNREFLDFLAEKRSGFVYIGRPTCPHCQVFSPILTKVVNEENLRVYYYDTDAANENKELKNEVLGAIEVNVVPTFMYIEKGVVKDRLKETDEEAALREFIERFR